MKKASKMTRKAVKTRFAITKDTVAEINRMAKELASKPNIKKYNFPVKDVAKMITAVYRKCNGKFDLDETYKFSAGYCGSDDFNFKEVNAIIELMMKHRPEECTVTKLANGKKILIIGEVAKELFKNAELDWNEVTVSSAGARVNLKLNTKKRMKCFGGETIEDEINRQTNQRFPKTWDGKKKKKNKNKSKNKNNKSNNKKGGK